MSARKSLFMDANPFKVLREALVNEENLSAPPSSDVVEAPYTFNKEKAKKPSLMFVPRTKRKDAKNKKNDVALKNEHLLDQNDDERLFENQQRRPDHLAGGESLYGEKDTFLPSAHIDDFMPELLLRGNGETDLYYQRENTLIQPDNPYANYPFDSLTASQLSSRSGMMMYQRDNSSSFMTPLGSRNYTSTPNLNVSAPERLMYA